MKMCIFYDKDMIKMFIFYDKDVIKMCVFDYKKGGSGVSPAHLRGCVCLLSGAKGQQPISALLHLSVQEVECRVGV